MKLDDLAKNVAAESGMSMVKARTLLDRVFGAIGDAVARGEDVTLPGFGKFASKATTARTGRNPRTGEPMQIAASTGTGERMVENVRSHDCHLRYKASLRVRWPLG